MTRPRLLLLAVAAVLVAGIGGFLVYDNLLRGDAVAPLALPSTSPVAIPTPGASASADAGAPTGTGAQGGVAGTWTVVEGSRAGYRVRERLAGLSADSDAVGRTTEVAGSITLVASGDGARLTAGSIKVDMTSLQSDESRRDGRLRTEGLETETYPEATFTIAGPMDLPASALAGSAASVTLAGDLVLHGVTRAVEIPAEVQLVDGQIRVAGSLIFSLADFDITAPNVGGFIISIADEGALEFLVLLAKA